LAEAEPGMAHLAFLALLRCYRDWGEAHGVNLGNIIHIELIL